MQPVTMPPSASFPLPASHAALLLLLVSVACHAQEQRIHRFEWVEPGQAHMTVDAPVHQTYQFLSSTNMVDWVPSGPLAPVSFGNDIATYRLDFEAASRLAAFKVEYRPIPPNPTPQQQLSAPGEEAVIVHLPDLGMPFENEATEVSNDDGLPVSLAHLLVAFSDAATVADFNDLLTGEDLALAGAVPEMQLGLLRRNSVTTLEDLNAQADRLASSGLFDAVALNMGMTSPRTIAGSGVGLHRVGQQSTGVDWTWEVMNLGEGLGGNNGFEMSRIPQLWNWMDYGYRQRKELGGHEVAVLEFAFNPHHDLHTNVTLGATSDSGLDSGDYDHGIAVTGIIAARPNNGGTEGVTPLPDRVRGIPFLQNSTTNDSYASVDLWQMRNLLRGPTAPRVFNISSGVPWYRIGDPTTTTRIPGVLYAEWLDELGTLWATSFRNLNRRLANTDYLVVCSAGNDDGVDAVYNSPMANVACRPELHVMAPQFLTVESVQMDRNPAAYSNYDFSGRGHAVSAGGTEVTVLAGPGMFDHRLARSGTSYAAPLVTGLASYLWSLEPSLTISEMKHLLLSSNTTFTVQSGERSPLVDGYSAALEIDRLRQSPDLHRALVDVDDGTKDGNLRMELAHWSEDPSRIHTHDGRRGDGKVTMRDLRAFRDAWIQVNGWTGAMDGAPTHFKRDLNQDGLVFDQPVDPVHPEPYDIRSAPGQALPEMIYSRFDFNGNGLLDQDGHRWRPGPENISPFKIDPDTPVVEQDVRKGLVRDVDVLLDSDVWEQDEENVLLRYDPGFGFNSGPYGDPAPQGWTTNSISDFGITTSVNDYLWSCDLHVTMEGATPNSWNEGYFDWPVPLMKDGLWIDSFVRMEKGRSGEWEGVVTVPFMDPDDIYRVNLPEGFPWVTVSYKKTQGSEIHQYSFGFQPELGEDIALSVAFDDLQFYSNTRQFRGYFGNSDLPVSEEIISKVPGSSPFTTFFIRFEDYDVEQVEELARLAAADALAGRLKFPSVFNGSPDLSAIMKEEFRESDVKVEVYGIIARYDQILGVSAE